jgi:hypothetical protein
VTGVPKEVPRELGALLEVFGGGGARVPEAETGAGVVDMGSFGVRVERRGGGEGGEAEVIWGELPG